MTEATAQLGKAPPHWALKAITKLHLFLHRITGGFNRLGGNEMCFVETRGAKTDRKVTVPLLYIPYGDGVLLVASQGGAPTHPAWYHNLRKNPDLFVTHRGRRMELWARLATDEEKETLWPFCEELYPPFATYRARTRRDIPIFICDPLPT